SGQLPGMPSRETWCCRAVSRVVLRLETRGTLGRHPEGLSRLGVLGTRGVLGMLPGMFSRLSTRDTWLTRNAPGGFLRRGRSGHKAYAEEKFEGVFRRDFRDTWRAPKESPKGFLRRAALVVGLEIDGWDGPVGSDRLNYRATLVVGSGLDEQDLLREGVSSSK